MSVVCVTSDDDIVESSRLLVYDIVISGYDKVKKEYLKKFKDNYDHGYNYIDIYDIAPHDRAHFAGVIENYTNSRDYTRFGYDEPGVTETLEDFRDRVRAFSILS